EQALAIAREIDDPALLARALTARCFIDIARYNTEIAAPYIAEAIGLARTIGDEWRLSQILSFQAYVGTVTGDPSLGRRAAEEGRDFADAIGDRFDSRACRLWLGWAMLWQGDLVGAVPQFGEVAAEAEAAHDVISSVIGLAGMGWSRAYQGDTASARA